MVNKNNKIIKQYQTVNDHMTQMLFDPRIFHKLIIQ